MRASTACSIEIDDLMRRTTGRTGAECMRELFQRDLANEEAWALITEKEKIYRELFGPVFAEVAGFKSFYAQALALDLKLGVGTAGDQHNIAFAMSHLQLAPAAKGDCGWRRRPARQTRARHLSGGRPPDERQRRRLHCF